MDNIRFAKFKTLKTENETAVIKLYILQFFFVTIEGNLELLSTSTDS